MPTAALAAPTARETATICGRPVDCESASAMKAAPPSWRVVTTRIPASARSSSNGRMGSAGTVKQYRAPAA